MTTSATKRLGALIIGAGLAVGAHADVQINDNLSLYGYVTATASNSSEDYTGGGSSDTGLLEVDSMKLQLTGSFDKTTGVASLHAFSDYEPVFLDTYVTYAIDDASSLTFGKFLSYHGYEAFDWPNMLQISYSNDMAAFIPAYHSGIRFDYAGEDGLSAGIAILDSVYGPTYYEGDHDLGDVGMEAFIKYSTETSNFYLGVANDADSETTMFDFWADTQLGSTLVAVEFMTADANGDDAYFWSVLAMPDFGSFTTTFRLSGGEDDTIGPGAKFTKYTISPAMVLTDNLAFLAEYSYSDYENNGGVESASYLAAQVVFTF